MKPLYIVIAIVVVLFLLNRKKSSAATVTPAPLPQVGTYTSNGTYAGTTVLPTQTQTPAPALPTGFGIH